MIIFVGDRGRITRARITALKDIGGAGWLSAFRAPEIKALVNDGAIQQSLFDEVNFAEIRHPDYEAERLVACRKPFLAAERARKREALLWATEVALDGIYVIRTSVGAYVGFGDQLSSRLVCGHDGVANLPTGRLGAARRPLMRAGHGVEGPDVVAVGEEFLDGVVDVGGKRQGSWS